MNPPRYIYILFSATPYRMGRWIRFITHEPYNHVSVALDADLKELYAFARRYYHTPFYGGFVTEQPDRFHHKGRTARISLYRLQVTESQWQALRRRVEKMRAQPNRYLYNHLSALMAPMHRKVNVRDAFTCAEFTVSVLQELGYPFSSCKYYSIDDIARKLEGHHIYTGLFPMTADEDPQFRQPHPVSHPWYRSTRDLLRLIWRKATA